MHPCKRHAPTYSETCADCLFEMLAYERGRTRNLEAQIEVSEAYRAQVMRESTARVKAAEKELSEQIDRAMALYARAVSAERERDAALELLGRSAAGKAQR